MSELLHHKLIRKVSGKASRDRRYKVVKQIHDYKDPAGNLHRKVFEHRDDASPYVPGSGTHEELNALRDQWRDMEDGGANVPDPFDQPRVFLTPDELAVAANATDSHPEDIHVEGLSALIELAEEDPKIAQELIDEHASDTAIAAAAIALVNAGAAGERPAETPAQDEATGVAGEPEETPEPAPGETEPEETRTDGTVVPNTGEAPAGRFTYGVDRTTDVPLAGGKTKDGKTVLIDRDLPQWILVPEHTSEEGNLFPESYVHQDTEIKAHEDAEFTELEAKGYQKAHDQNGNAATDQFARDRGMDPKVYRKAQAQSIAECRKKAERGEATDIHPHLDRRPYEDGKLVYLLETPRAADRNPAQPSANQVRGERAVREEKTSVASGAEKAPDAVRLDLNKTPLFHFLVEKGLKDGNRTSLHIKTKLNTLGFLDKLAAWDKATDEEREKYGLKRGILTSSESLTLNTVPPEERPDVRARLAKVRSWSPSR